MSDRAPTRPPTRRTPHPLRHTYAMTLLGTVLPGAGLLQTRLRRFGTALLSITGLVLLFAIYTLLRNGLVGSALSLGLSSSRLMLLFWAVLLGAVVWMASIVLTAAVTRPHGLSRDERLATTMVAFLCCLAVAAPSLYVARTLTLQRSVVETVFANDPTSTGTSTAGIPVVGADDPWKAVPRVNVLLIGSDAGSDRVGVRPDSMMVASINTRTGDTVLIGIPRNLERAPIPASNPLSTLYPNGYDCGDMCLMNAIWTLAEEHADLFPGEASPGLRSTRDVIGEILGLRIDNAVVIDLSGFAALVNAMGGVDVNVKERVCIGCKALPDGSIVGTTGWIEPGPQHLDGYHALWYARSRASTDDFSRMRRQRCVVGALVDQVSPAAMLLRYPQLAEVLKADVSIDIPQAHLQAWVPLIERIQREGTMRSLPLTNKVIDVVNPDYAKIRALVANAISDNPTSSTTPASTTPSTPAGTGSTTPPATSSSTDSGDGLTTLKAAC